MASYLRLVINSGNSQDVKRSKTNARIKPAVLLRCHECDGREFLETLAGVFMKNGKPSGGTKQMFCASCYLRGKRVLIA